MILKLTLLSAGVSNSSVRLDWAVEQFNRTCFESFKIFWFTNQTNSSYYQQSVGLDHRSATIGSLVPDTAYYFQVQLETKVQKVFTITEEVPTRVSLGWKRLLELSQIY